MLKHTMSALKKIGDDIKKIKNITNYVLISVNFAFLIYLFVTNLDNKVKIIINTILLVLTIFTLIIMILYNKKFLTKEERKAHKAKLYKIKHAITISKILTKAYSLGIVLYGMYFATAEISPFSIIMTTLMLLLWIVSVAFELFVLFFDKEMALFMNSLQKDFAWAINTKKFAEKTVNQVKEKVSGVKNSVVGFFKKEKKAEELEEKAP